MFGFIPTIRRHVDHLVHGSIGPHGSGSFPLLVRYRVHWTGSDIGFAGPASISVRQMEAPQPNPSGTVPLINAASSLTRCIYFRAFPHVDHPSIAMISGGSEYRLVHNGPVDINLFFTCCIVFTHNTYFCGPPGPFQYQVRGFLAPDIPH